MTKNTTKFETPTILSFEAKLLCSDAVMHSGNWQEIKNAEKWQPIKIEEKFVRGTKSHWQAGGSEEHKDHAKFLQDIAQANPQTVDNAALPFDADTLKISWTLRVLGNLTQSSACNNPEYDKKLSGLIKNYAEEHKFDELAKRYAINIANGRFLWRNRVGADEVKILVYLDGEQEPLKFNAYDFTLSNFDGNSEDINKLANAIKEGLSDTTGEKFTFIKVVAFSKLGNGQQVYPSQDMNMEKSDKVLYKLNAKTETEVAAMHSQKIGNAIRTIDNWHSKADKSGPIAVEPYGSVTVRGQAYRPLNNGSFYKVLESWMNDKEPTDSEKHYMMATLIRGGVFSGETKKK
ncbi:MAG: type I-F CRISPR-associated protein Csy3 [Methylococcaceae bacterium]